MAPQGQWVMQSGNGAPVLNGSPTEKTITNRWEVIFTGEEMSHEVTQVHL